MRTAQLILIVYRWFSGLRSLGLITILKHSFGAVFAYAGATWLIIEIATYFGTDFQNRSKPYFWLIATVGIIYSLVRIIMHAWAAAPRRSVRHIIDGTDVWLEIAIADVFEIPGAIIVPSSVTFDTTVDDKLIHSQSILGQFIKRFYRSHLDFDKDVQKCLANIQPLQTLTKADKTAGKLKEFAVGTTLRVAVQNHAAYIVAIGKYNKSLTTRAELSDLQNALPNLWEYVRTCGELEILKTPVLGSGRLRINVKLADLVKEIVRSFVAATQEGRFCEGLTIAIHPRDLKKVSFDELAKFIECESCYRGIGLAVPLVQSVPVVSGAMSGTPVPVSEVLPVQQTQNGRP